MGRKYLVLLVDRNRARMLILIDGVIDKHIELKNDNVPQKVKNGDNAWDAQDKIFRHIEDHLHRHLVNVANSALEFTKYERIAGVLIGGHRPLFAKVEKHLRYPLSKKIQGHFVTELKIPQDEITKKAIKMIEKVEKKFDSAERKQKLESREAKNRYDSKK